MMLADFASLLLDELTAQIERMLQGHHKPRHDYAARNFNATRSDTGIPSPADTAAGGNYSEDRA